VSEPVRSKTGAARSRLARWLAVGAVVVTGLAAGFLAATLAPDDPSGEDRGGALNPGPIPRRLDLIGVSREEAGCSDVESPPVQRTRIVVPDQKHPPYSSTPPTSGPHFLSALPAAIYFQPHQPEQVVSNLAQGDVVVWHTGVATTQEKRNQLIGLFLLYRSEELVAVEGSDLGLEDPIVLTAWGKLQRCERFSGEAVADFFERYKGRGPGI
jgi:hypothetical protein